MEIFKSPNEIGSYCQGLTLDLPRPRLRRNERFGQDIILLGKVRLQVLSGQRESSIECGAERGRSKRHPLSVGG